MSLQRTDTDGCQSGMTAKNLLLICLLVLIACRRNEDSSSPCMDMSKCADVNCQPGTNLLKFILLDEETGEDLVFADDPLIRQEDIIVRNTDGEELAVMAYSGGFGKAHLSVETANSQALDTLYLEVQGQPVYTLYPRFCNVTCCTPMAYEMRTQKGEVKRQAEHIFPLTY